MARREYKGNAVPTRLQSPITDSATSCSINSNAGWPTGGANGPFEIIFDPDVPGKEEAVLATDQSGGNITGMTRGIGDTSPTSHGVGADGSVIHGTTKLDADEANRHINVTTDDNHTQYMKTDGTRHDLTARHSAGTVVPTTTPVAIGTALAEGGGTQLARASHVHIIGAGAINSDTMFTAGVIGAGRLGAGAISASSMFAAGVVDAIALATDSVGSAEISPGAIDDLAHFLADLFTLTHSRAAPSVLRTTSSTTYVNWPTTENYSLSHTKKIAGSRILVVWIGGAFMTGGNNRGDWAVRVDAGVDNVLNSFFFSELDAHRIIAGAALLTGLGAGAHTYNLRAKVVGNTLNADTGDSNQFFILELP